MSLLCRGRQFVLLLFILFANVPKSQLSPPKPEFPQVTIQEGIIQGTFEKSRDGALFHSFQGIPYGHVPKRFMPSERAPPWDGVFHASERASWCSQIGIFGVEDCLTLNVYTPHLRASDAGNSSGLPVMFYIHGGAFGFFGAEANGPEYFMDHEIVLVTVNYRLGILGFLNLDIDEAPGNMAMKDMVVALTWVRDNIEYFGGNKDLVTIFGLSAGAAAVDLLTLSPLSKGLFHQAICHSGSAAALFAFRNDVKENSIGAARILGCSGPPAEILSCLQGKSLLELYLVSTVVSLLNTGWVFGGFLPTLEIREPSDSSPVFLSEEPWNLMKSGQFHENVPVIHGVTSQEANIVKYSFVILPYFIRQWLVHLLPNYRMDTTGMPEALNSDEAYRVAYDPEMELSYETLVESAADAIFIAPARFSALHHSKKSSVWLYVFGEDSQSLFHYPGLAHPGHADDTVYLFNIRQAYPWMQTFSNFEYVGQDHPLYNFTNDYIRIFTTFARTGKPGKNFAGKSFHWEPVKAIESDKITWFHINQEPEVKEESPEFRKRMSYWMK